MASVIDRSRTAGVLRCRRWLPGVACPFHTQHSRRAGTRRCAANPQHRVLLNRHRRRPPILGGRSRSGAAERAIDPGCWRVRVGSRAARRQPLVRRGSGASSGREEAERAGVSSSADRGRLQSASDEQSGADRPSDRRTAKISRSGLSPSLPRFVGRALSSRLSLVKHVWRHGASSIEGGPTSPKAGLLGLPGGPEGRHQVGAQVRGVHTPTPDCQPRRRGHEGERRG
jgi:hypothetical protein